MKFTDQLQRWNARFSETTDYLFGEQANHYLTTTKDLLPKGKVLSIADGEGRNSVWLAQQGLDVEAFDFSPVGIRKAEELAQKKQVHVKYHLSDWQSFDWKPNFYDGVVGIFFQFVDPQDRATLFEKMKSTLKPGGTIIIQGYGQKQLEYGTGGPKELDHLYTEELLRDLLSGFEFLQFISYDAEVDEGAGHRGMSSLIGLVAKKPL